MSATALFSGPVALDAAGHASIPLDLPDFTGELRLMAVAYQGQRVGAVTRAQADAMAAGLLSRLPQVPCASLP